MRTVHTEKTIPVYENYYDDMGMLINAVQTGEEQVTVTELVADDGKLFVRISDGALLGERITLGTEDSIENYEEIEKEMIL